MPSAKRKQIGPKGHLWEVAGNSDGSVITVRIGSYVAAQVPGPLLGVARLAGDRLAVWTAKRTLSINLHTGDVTSQSR